MANRNRTGTEEDSDEERLAPDLSALAAPEREEKNRAIVQEGFWAKVRDFAARVPFLEDAVASYYAMRDPATPRRVKLLILAALAYFVAPTDAIPDLIVGLGFTDDATLFMAAWALIRDHVTDVHRDKARAALSDESRGSADAESA